MKLNDQKDYEDAMKTLEALTNSDESEEFESEISELVDAIIEYENFNYPIETPPDWAMLEFHIYDRLCTSIKNLPFSPEERIEIYRMMEEHSEVPAEILSKVKALKLADLIP